MRFRFAVVAMLCTLTVVGAASAGQADYAGPNAHTVYGQKEQSGFNTMQWNRVYRPVGRWYSLWYETGGTAYQFDRNLTDNPFWHNQSSGYVTAVCVHSDGDDQSVQYPVTCQYYA